MRWRELVPKGKRENLEFRRRVLARAREDLRFRELLKKACAEDLVFYADVFVWQFNPRKEEGRRVEPWISWDFQEELFDEIVRCKRDEEDLVVQKSKDMGVTWCFLIACDHAKRFKSWDKSLLVSKSEDAVDKADMDSLMSKLDFIHRHLPGWLAGPRKERSMYRGYGKNGEVAGEASTGRAGVGGRASDAFIDEFPLIREGQKIRERTTDTTDVRFFNGTHLGVDNEFYRLTHETPEIRKMTIHWSRHPEKKRGLYRSFEGGYEILDTEYEFDPDYEFVTNGYPLGGPCPGIRSPWYDKACLRKGSPRAVAMDLDIDPIGSVEKFFDSRLVTRLIQERSANPVWEGDVRVDSGGRMVKFVECSGGPLRMWIRPYDAVSVGRDVYGAGSDVGMGTGATNSTWAAVSATTGMLVAMYANPLISIQDFAGVTAALGRAFSDRDGRAALFCWDGTGAAGGAFSQAFGKLGYSNVFYMDEATPLDRGKRESKSPGYFFREESWRRMLMEFQVSLANGVLYIPSRETLEELKYFKYDLKGNVVNSKRNVTGDPSGARTNHSDRVTGALLAMECVKRLSDFVERVEVAREMPKLHTLEGRRRYHEAIERHKERWS